MSEWKNCMYGTTPKIMIEETDKFNFIKINFLGKKSQEHNQQPLKTSKIQLH